MAGEKWTDGGIFEFSERREVCVCVCVSVCTGVNMCVCCAWMIGRDVLAFEDLYMLLHFRLVLVVG